MFGFQPPNVRLRAYHPAAVHVFKLWQIFLDNVNPFVKIFHAPTVQQQILEACGNMDHIPKDLEALMFGIYACAVMSTTDEDCLKIMGEKKDTLLARFGTGAQCALLNAGILKSPELMTLQALLLLLVCEGLCFIKDMLLIEFQVAARPQYDPRNMWVLCGVAVRIAQRMGLHRDGADLGLSVFDTEMRRRVWWELVVFDGRVAELAGSATSLLTPPWDTKVPLNVNDSDLNQDMNDPPAEHNGMTEMAVCRIRYDIESLLRRQNQAALFDGGWSKLSSGSVSLAAKDKLIDEFETMIEEKYLRHCDSSIPLHHITYVMGKVTINKMRLVAHHPRQYPDRGAHMSQAEKDMLFNASLSLIRTDNMTVSKPSMARFRWQLLVHFQIDAFVYLINELSHRTSGDLSDEAWDEALQAFEHRPRIITDTWNPLFVAIGNLTLKAWDAREKEHTLRNPNAPPLETPDAIAILRARKAEKPQRVPLPVAAGSSSASTPYLPPGGPNGPHGHPGQHPNASNRGWQGANNGMQSGVPEAPMGQMEDSYPPDLGVSDSPVDWALFDSLIHQSQLHNSFLDGSGAFHQNNIFPGAG